MAALERGFEKERLLYRSQQTYRGCVSRFLDWAKGRWADGTPEDVVSAYLGEHAPDWAAATQSQALNAIVFFFSRGSGKATRRITSVDPRSTREAPACVAYARGGARRPRRDARSESPRVRANVWLGISYHRGLSIAATRCELARAYRRRARWKGRERSRDVPAGLPRR